MKDGQNDLQGTPEAVAYRLLLLVLAAEGRLNDEGGAAGGAKLSRNLVLDAYADCLEAVNGERARRPLRGAA